MKRLVLSGYYGYGNLGDEAILAAILDQLRLREVETVVLSSNPAWTSEVHGCRALKRTALGPVTGALARADLFVQGGGSLIQDATSWRSPLFYLAQLLHARIAGTPWMLLSQGIGPIQRGWLHYLTRETLVHGAALTLRDTASLAWALGNLPHDLPIRLTADPVFLLEPADPQRIEWLTETSGLADVPRPWVFVSAKGSTKHPTERQAWIEGLNALAMEIGGSIILAPFFPTMDRGFTTMLQRELQSPQLLLPDTLTPQEMLGLYGQAALVLAGRLHPLIFAANRRVPFAAISYDPKMDAACAEFDLQPVARRPLLGWRTMVDGMLDVLEDTRWEERYATVLPLLERRALDAFAVLDQVLAGALRGSAVTVD
ncbi:MAG: hypothetical protein GEEBNDBF_01166 [bacterium]|nr:hypothetical protein [bacterium]